MRIALAFTFLIHLGALDPVTASIEEAQSLALKKNRSEAAAVLRRAIDVTSSRSGRGRLREQLVHITRVFFTDKGQRAFETAQTVLFDNPDAAALRLREALALENGNRMVRLALVRYHLNKNDCTNARAEIAASRTLNPNDGDAAVLELRTMLCDKNFTGLRDLVRALPSLDKWQESLVAYVQGRDQLHQGAHARAAEFFARSIADAPRFPEPRYHLSRAEAARGGGEEHLRKYVSLCKSLTGRDRREFALEPRVCANQKEAEDELAKKTMDL